LAKAAIIPFTPVSPLPSSPSSFDHIWSLLEQRDQSYRAPFNAPVPLSLGTHFQPIYSLSHRRVVGYEALMRAQTPDGLHISPLEVLNSVGPSDERMLHLDRLCRTMHLANYAVQSRRAQTPPHWIFLNFNAEVFLNSRRNHGQEYLQQLSLRCGVPIHRMVVEVLEDAVRHSEELQDAVAYLRELGCLIALDDFGTGHSNFDRVWNIRPEIVKLDRSLIVRANADVQVRRFLVQMVQMLHETGALVLVEGIETSHEAYIALEADVDFVQGFYFARPGPSLFETALGNAAIDGLWQEFDQKWRREKGDYQEIVAPYINAIGYAAVLLSACRSFEESSASFLALPLADFCYLLDAAGQQIGTNRYAQEHPACDLRFAPVADARAARWARRPYFRRSLESIGKVQVTRPYLSISTARLCVTLSASFVIDGETRVLCGDILWAG
jgi:EAL domain-containing protein (putative c-di-GMP-specific phosphodiesterase class I)